MKEYDPKEIEAKWQSVWEKDGFYPAEDFSKKPKWFSLMEFPYPSGDGLHTGHVRGYTAMDVISRKRRMEGFNVMFPIGWDAFGLPTENYAIKTGRIPADITKENTDNFREQFRRLGMSFDWSREVNTTDPNYYKWTQWLFLKFLENGLAYKDKININWCPKDKIGLANEEVIDGKCERCGTVVEKREREQWMLAITKYAERLDRDLDEVDYPERVKLQQRNWIGRSEGAEISFKVIGSKEEVKVFTTRPDTIFGATYMVLAPEHPFVEVWKDKIENLDEVRRYQQQTKLKSEIERGSEGKEKTGVELKGISAINPGTMEEIPIWIADYVLPHYGTGAIMAVPSDDERDMQFAEKFGLKIIRDYQKAGFEDYGKKVVRFKLRDWVFSRQRYWGEPIPVVHCEKCGTVPVPEKDLPVLLPEVKNYLPTDSGESPLANISEWVNVACPKCDGPAKRETDTMPNWAGSSWYFLRYIDPENNEQFASMDKLKYWMPVDWYNGGMEHTTLHLLYSRFWNKFLFDLNLVPTSEPYKKRTSHGMILAPNGEKMSKSRGNVINPDQIVGQFGADTLRLYEMFMGPFEQSIAWSEESLIGPRRFIEKVWKLKEKISEEETAAYPLMHQTIKKVTGDIESMRFNTAISSLMILANDMERRGEIGIEEFENTIKLLAPFAPHVTEELWYELGHNTSIHAEPWPKYDESKTVASEIKIVIQVNGKVRGSFSASVGITESEAFETAEKLPEITKWTVDKSIIKGVYVPGKLVNFVVN